jgi:DNA-binding NtrC family response regulator
MGEASNTILVVDDTPANIGILLKSLGQDGVKILVASDGESAIEQIGFVKPDLILLDVMMPGMNGFETCRVLKKDKVTQDIPIIFMTALSDTEDKVKGFALGAVDYVTKPFQQEEVIARVNAHLTIRNFQLKLEQLVAERTAALTESNRALRKALQELETLKNRLQEENIYLREEIKLQHNFENIVYRSDAFKKVLHQVEQVAATGATVLIIGETGTGKELIARAVHDISDRKDRPLVKVNCAALSENLIESELFGHEKGAFTGAMNRRQGRFELAHNGTLFLDEIGDLPPPSQAKQLRVLQEGEFERVGGTETFEVDVRVIAATNRDLEEMINAGTFRQDLFFRLNVFPIPLPPLRERIGDVPLLTRHFVRKYADKIGKPIDVIPKAVINALEDYTWPGNVRELENVIERSVIVSTGDPLSIDGTFERHDRGHGGSGHFGTLEEVEANHIRRVLEETNWRVAGRYGAARRLAINPSTLRSRMKKLGIEKPSAEDEQR